ncbi:SSU ribosomal protein S13p [Cutibacterium acnes JCM 18918]|nr:SSU ribosomal protein S13p [Cutibacterium acnes JCM 18918]
MARLIGVDLPRDKRLEVALTYIYGIGRTRATETLKATGISGDLRVHELTDDQLVALRDHIEANYHVEGDLRREVAADIRRKIEIGTYQAVVTAADSRFVVSAPAPTPVPARVRGRPSPRRRPSESSPTGHSPTVTDAQITLISGETSHGYCRPQGCTQDQGAPQGEEERRRRSGAHQEHVQQHHHRYY